MTFIWSSLLVLLLLVPLLALLYFRMQQRRKNFAKQYGFGLTQTAEVKEPSLSETSSRRRHVPAMIFLLGIAILLFSLSRPQATVSLPKYEGTVILVFDVSGSMAADDMQPTFSLLIVNSVYMTFRGDIRIFIQKSPQ